MLYRRMKLLGSPLALQGQLFFLTQVLKADDVLQIRNEPDGIAAAVQASRPDHPNIAHGVACMTCMFSNTQFCQNTVKL